MADTVEIIVRAPGLKGGSRKINLMAGGMPGNIRRGFHKAGSILMRDMMIKLSGESHVQYPDTSNPYPGVIHGILKGSVNKKVKATSLTVGPGPQAGYARDLEYRKPGHGGYPFVGPTWRDAGKKAVDAFVRIVATRPLRGL